MHSPEVQPEHVQPAAEAAAVFLTQKPFGSVHWEASGDNDVCAATQQLQAALVAARESIEGKIGVKLGVGAQTLSSGGRQ